jgi:hypothetical protein
VKTGAGPPRVRYRKLGHKEVSPFAMLDGSERIIAGDSGGRRAVAAAEAVVELDVKEEAFATLDQVQAMVARGELVPEDLVDLGDGWQSIDDCVPFDDVCEPYRVRRKRRYVLQVLGVMAAIVAYFIFSYHHQK